MKNKFKGLTKINELKDFQSKLISELKSQDSIPDKHKEIKHMYIEKKLKLKES